MQKFNFDYDKENDDLLLHSPKSKSKGGVDFGEIIIDYNNKKEFVGIQIMNVSKLLCKSSGEPKTKIRKILESLKGCKIDLQHHGKMLIINILLIGKQNERLYQSLPMPHLTESSPALVYA